MINSFKNYLKQGKAKSKTPDPEESKALLNKSKARLDYIKNKEINTKTANFILEDAYEAVREAAQSLMSKKGFKPYSPEATISFIEEFHKNNFDEESINRFDYFRQLRNNSIYKAEPVTQKDAKASLLFAKTFIKKVKDLLNKR